jgi:tight adherence protein B
MQERLEQIASVVVKGEESGPAAVVIRRTSVDASALSGLATRVLRFTPEIPEANIISWKVVVIIGVAAGFGSSSIIGNLAGGEVGLVAGVLIGFGVIRFIFTWEKGRYARMLFQQLPDMIELLVSATRAGLPVSEAIRNVSKEMLSPTKEAMAIVVNDIAIGRPVDEALLRMYERTGLPEYAIVAVAIGVQAQSGGALAESLQNVAEIVRQRLTIASRARALSSEAKASAVILVALPFVSGGALAFVNPGYLDLLFVDPRGIRLLSYGIVFMVLGILTMRWMINNAVQD